MTRIGVLEVEVMAIGSLAEDDVTVTGAARRQAEPRAEFVHHCEGSRQVLLAGGGIKPSGLGQQDAVIERVDRGRVARDDRGEFV